MHVYNYSYYVKESQLISYVDFDFSDCLDQLIKELVIGPKCLMSERDMEILSDNAWSVELSGKEIAGGHIGNIFIALPLYGHIRHHGKADERHEKKIHHSEKVTVFLILALFLTAGISMRSYRKCSYICENRTEPPSASHRRKRDGRK